MNEERRKAYEKYLVNLAIVKDVLNTANCIKIKSCQ